MICSNALNSREKPAVSPMSGSSTFDIDKWKKNGNGANLQLSHALRTGGVIRAQQKCFMLSINCFLKDISSSTYMKILTRCVY